MIVFGSRRLVDQGTIFTFPSVCLALFPRKVVAKVASGAVNIRSPFTLLHACFATFTGTRVACVGRQRRTREFEAAVLLRVTVGRKHADQGLARTARMLLLCVPVVYPT